MPELGTTQPPPRPPSLTRAALFFFALYLVRIVLFSVRLRLNKQFPQWEKKELKTNDPMHPPVDLDYIREQNGIPRREQIV